MTDKREQLNGVAEEWAAAELRGDVASLAQILTEDFVGVGPYGFLLTKDEWLERHDSRKLSYESFGLEEVQVRLYGEAAVMVARQTQEGKYEDNELPVGLRTTLFFARQGGGWRLAGIHMSFMAGGA